MGVHKQKARLLVDRKRYDLALKEIGEEMRENPDDPDCHSLLGLCLFHQKKYPEAFEQVQETIRLAPNGYYGYYLRAWMLCRSVEAPAQGAETLHWASINLEKAVQLRPANPDAWLLWSEILAKQKRLKKALETVEKGLSFNPRHKPSLDYRSYLLSQRGKMKEAQETADQSLALDPESSWAQANQGWLFLASGKYREAQSAFQESLRLNPQGSWAQEGLFQATLGLTPFWGGGVRFHRKMRKWWLILWVFGLYGIFIGVLTLSGRWELAGWGALALWGLTPLLVFAGVVASNWRLVVQHHRSRKSGLGALSQVSRPRKILVLCAGALSVGGVLAGKITGHLYFMFFSLVGTLGFVVIAGGLRRQAGLPRHWMDSVATGCLLGGLGLIGLSTLGMESTPATWAIVAELTGLALIAVGIVASGIARRMKRNKYLK